MMRPRLDPAFLSAPIAHRCLHDPTQRRPENSMAAAQAAVEAGLGIELDLQLSADGEAMVFHDYETQRLTGQAGRTNQRTAQELKALGLLDSDAPMPTLNELLALVQGRVPLLIELKDQSGMFGPSDGRLEAATAQALEGYSGPTAVMSFNPFMVGHLAKLAPQIARGLTTYEFPAHELGVRLTTEQEKHRQWLASIAAYDEVGASFISHHWRDLGAPRVAELKGQGADVLCWTVRSVEDEQIARRVAQNITFEGYRAPTPVGA